MRTVYGKYFPKTVLLFHSGYFILDFQWCTQRHKWVVISVMDLKGIRAWWCGLHSFDLL